MTTTKTFRNFSILGVAISIIALSSCGGKSKESASGENSGSSSTETGSQAELKAAKNSGTTSGHRYKKRYGIESGYIEMETSGSMMKGREVIYFTDWGMKESKVTTNTIEAGGMKQENTSVSIMDGDWTYSYDPKTKKGTKVNMKLLDEIAQKQNTDELGEVGEEMMKKMGGVKTGSGEVLGKNCDIWEVKSLKAKTWVYKYVTLKTSVDQMGMKIVSTAVKFEENPNIPNGQFEIPSDVTFTEMSNPLDRLKGKMKGN